jgi:hypothetical protein
VTVKLLEYQAKRQFARVGIEVPAGRLARTPDEAATAARELGRVAVKAQVPIGGRGKAGGIAVVSSPEEAHRRRPASWPWRSAATRCARCGARPGLRSIMSCTWASPSIAIAAGSH